MEEELKSLSVFDPDNPSPTAIQCVLGCGHMTTTGICAFCAHDLLCEGCGACVECDGSDVEQ